MEGVAPGFVPPLFDRALVRETIAIPEEEGRSMAVRLAREEGLLGGTSTGLNVAAALRLARGGATVATVVCDTGLKYLSGNLFSAL